MIFRETPLSGAYVVDIEKLADTRGFFARTWCQAEFEKQGLISRLVQASLSFNKHKGTLRGLHFQKVPSKEAKLVRVTQGAIFDVIVDLRPDSSTFLKYYSINLNAQNHSALYEKAWDFAWARKNRVADGHPTVCPDGGHSAWAFIASGQ